MEKHITDERTGLKYELVGNYYLIAGDDETEDDRPIGIWGQRHLYYIKQHKRSLYTDLKMSGKLNNYLADINEEAEEMFSQLVKQMANQQAVTEQLKAENQMIWVQKMNSICNSAREIINSELIFI
ncbi:MAG TPA: TnpV protein [Clostridiales bacterium]|jgi:hypothetical protein|nr:TnpV protein [Clostridiales bacterium]